MNKSTQLVLWLSLLCSFAKAQTPTFSVQPSLNNGFVCYGNNATISASVLNADVYQLESQNPDNSWSNYGGYTGSATGITLSISIIAHTQDLNFRIRAKNNTSGDVAYSNEFFIDAQRPEFSVQPVNQTACYNEDVTFYTTASGTGLSYEWEYSENIDGSYAPLSADSKYKNVNTANLTLKGIRHTDEDFFRVKVTDANGCFNTSNSAGLNVNYMFIVQPTTSAAICEGSTTDFFTYNIQGSPIEYSWKYSTASAEIEVVESSQFQNVNSERLTINGVPGDLEDVAVKIEFPYSLMNSDGSSTTGTCFVERERKGYTINPQPSQPAFVSADSVCGSGTVDLEISSSESVEWYANSTGSAALATSARFTTPSINASTYYFYRAKDTNDCFSQYDSTLAKVNPVPSISLSSVASICPADGSFNIPYTSLQNGDQFDLTLTSGSILGFSELTDEPLSTSPQSISVPSTITNGNYTFGFKLENSITKCFASSQDVNLYVKKPTEITSNPVTQEICEGQPVTLSAAGTGEGLLTYQWYFNGSALEDEKESSLTFDKLSLTDEGNYYCAITAECGTKNTTAATLTVKPITRINTQPTNTAVCQNQTATFSTVATGSGTLTYQWKMDGNNIGTNSNSLSLENVTLDDDQAEITCTVTGECGDSTSTTAVLTVYRLPVAPVVADTGYCINSSPDPLTANALTSHTLNWYGTNATGGTGSNSASTASTTASGDFSYYVSQTDANSCESERAEIHVTITPLPISNLSSSASTVCPSGSINKAVSFLVASSGGNGSYTYQWGKNGSAINGETGTSFSSTGGGNYYIVTTSGYCSITSTVNISEAVMNATNAPTVSISGETAPYNFCSGEDITLTASLSVSGNTLKWYNTNIATAVLSSNTDFNLTNISVDASYFAAEVETIGALTCETDRSEIAFTVDESPDASYIVENETCTANNDGKITLTPLTSDVPYTYKIGSLAFQNSNIFTGLTEGNYSVTLKSNNGCETVKSISIGTNPRPVFTTEPSNKNVCEGSTVTFETATDITVNYQWQKKFPSGNWTDISSENSSDLVLNNVGNSNNPDGATYRLIAGSATCFETSAEASLAVTIIDETSLSGTTSICSGGNATLTATGCNGTVTWSDNQTGTSIEVSPSASTSYTAKCKVGLCEEDAINSVIVSVKPLTPQPGITATLNEICFGQSSELTATGCSGDLHWSTSETTTSITVNPTTSVEYSVTCTIDGCPGEISKVTVKGHPELMAGSINTNSAINCAGYNPPSIGSTDAPSGGKGALSVLWELSENCVAQTPTWSVISGATGNTFNPSALYTTTCYRRKVVDECGTELFSNISTINIVDDPEVIVSSDKSSICSGESFELTAAISGGTGTCSITWQKNSKSSAAGSSFWEDLAGSANTLSVTGLENTSTENISVYFRAIYDCDLTNCNKATADAIEVVVAPVVANVVTADKSIICEGEEVILTSTGCMGTISWSNGSVLAQQTVSPTSTQYFVAICSVTGCSEIVKDSVEITVKPGVAAPTLSATLTEICFGQSSEITAYGCTGDLLWITSETTTSITVSPTSAVEYSVTCSLNGCTSPAAKITVTGYPELVAGSISSSSDINCAGYNPPEISSTAAASGGKGVLSTSWESSENCSASTPTWNTISGANGNTYNPIALSVTTCYRRKVVDECGTELYSNISTINIVDDPEIIVSSDKNNICSGESFELTAAISGGTGTCSITWQKNSKSSAAGSSFWEDMTGSANTLPVTGLENTSTENFSVYYRAIYDCDLTNCNKTTSEAIEVVVAPVVANVVTADKSIICEGEEVILTSTGCMGTISWSNGSVLAQQTVSPTSTQYFVAICSVTGCSEIVKDSVEITVKPGVAAPTLSATLTEICFGQSSEITASGCTGDLLWITSETTTSITVSPTSAVEYSVTCSLNGCTSPAAKITVTGYPELVAGSISSSSDINCAGYNPPEISSTAKASGGKGVLSTSWESSENCSAPTPTWNTISGANGNTYNPIALSVTTCYRRKVIDECGTVVYSNISTINIVDDPQVIVSSDKNNICSGESLELTAAISGGTGTCSIIWQKNTRSSAAGSSFWENLAGSAITLSVTDLENTSTENISAYFRAIYDCDLTNCNKATSEVIEVVVAPVVANVVTADKSIICEGEEVILTSTGCMGTISWSNGSVLAQQTVSPTSTQYFAATCSVTGCSEIVKDSVEITVKPGVAAPTLSATLTEICFGQSSEITASGCTGELLWSTSETTTSITVSPNSAVEYSVTCSLNGCTSPAAKITVTGYPELVAGSISSSSDINCAGYNPPEISSTAAASGGKGVLSTSWESSENCSAPSPTWNTISGATGNTFNPTALSVTTCYRRKVVDECGTELYSNISSKNIVDDPEIIVSSDKNNICSGESLELTAAITGGTGTCSIVWQKNSKSSAAGSSFWEDMAGSANTLPVTDLENATTSNISVYFRAIYDCDLTNCNKATAEAIEVVVAPVVANVVSADKSIICEGEEVVLTSSGCLGTISWSNGSVLAQQTVSPSSTQYFVATCSVAGCSEIVKDSVEITVKQGVAAPTLTATTSEICFGQSSEITASGCTGGLLWSTSETTTSITVSPTSVVEYSVTCSLNGCTSPAAKITVTGYPELVAGSISSSSDINCAGYNPPEISSTAAASGGKGLLSISWESSENCSAPTPTWNTISGANGNTYNPIALSVTTCYRRKVIDECGTEVYSNISTINIVDDPQVIVSSDKNNICSGESLELTAAISGGTGTCSITWQKNSKSSAAGSSFWEDMAGSANTLPVTDLENATTSNFSVYFRAIYDCDLTNCNKATAEAIEVVVLPTNEVMVNIQDTTICSGIPVLLKASSCGGTLTWSDGNTVSERIVNPEVSTNYTVSCTGTCGTFQKTVSIKVIPGLSKPVNTTPFSAIQPNTLTFSASGTNLKWYTADHPDSLITAAPELTEKGEYTYWVSQSNSTCESPRLQIDAKIYPQLSITQEPYDQFDCEGNSVNFLVEAEGAGDLVYQWQRKRPGETEFVNVYDEDDGIKNAQQKAIRVSGAGGKNNPHLTQFRCIVGDSVSVAYTIPKTLYANVINRTLPNLKACVGQDFDLNLSDYLEVIGSVTGYQWQVRDDAAGEWIDLQDDPTLTGTKTASLKFTNLQTWRSRKYRCRIFFNTGGFECIENTDQTLLRVGEYPKRPADQTVEYCEGRPTRTLSFNAKPNNDLWFSSLEAWDTGSTRPPKPTSDKPGVYTWWYASVNNEGCVGPKASYTVTIHPAPPAPENTTPAVVELGDTLRFSAKGQYLKWFKSRTGRTFSFNSPFYVKPDYYTHYVSQVSQYGCEGPRTFIGAEIKSPFGINDGLEAVADCEGNSVRFEANQVGIPPLEYQWQRKRPEDSTFFTLENDTLDYIRISNVGSLLDPHLSLYRVVVTDSTDSSYVSDPITLYVNGILGNIDKAYYCSGQIWSPDTINLDFRGEVEYYQLQKQIGRSWMVVDSTDSLAFTIHHLQDTLDGDYRIRAVFKAENGATCARSTDEFQFNRGVIPDSLGTKNMDICQYDYLYRGQLDNTENSYRWLFREDTVYNWLLEDSLQFTLAEDTTLWYSVVNKYGCFGAFDSLNIHVKPAPVLEIQNPVLTACKLEAIEKPIWLSDTMNVLYFDEQLDSSLVKESVLVSDSVQISQYWIVKTDSGGCQSPAIQITFEVNDCKMEEDTVVNLTEENGENGKQLNLSEHSDVYQPNPYAEKPETFFNWRQEAVNTPQCDVFPNPVSRNESMNIQLKGVRPENIDVLDIQGRNMEYRVLFKEETNQKMAIMANLNEGVYILRVRDAKGNSCIQRIVLKN